MTRADRVHSTPPTNTSAITPTTRRGFLAQAAVAAAGGAALGMALPLPGSAEASARVPDPISALIQAHRAAYAAWYAAVDEECKLEEELPEDFRQSQITASGETIFKTDDIRWIAAEQRSIQTWAQHKEIAWEIATVPATTLAGIAALTAYVAECEGRPDPVFWPLPKDGDEFTDKWDVVFHRNLASALAALVDGGRA